MTYLLLCVGETLVALLLMQFVSQNLKQQVTQTPQASN
jgi:hypothetical protein